MPGATVGLNLNMGYPGTVSALPDSVIRSFISDGTVIVGQPIKVTTTNGESYAGLFTGASGEKFAGIAVRNVQTYPNQSMDFDYADTAVPEGMAVDILLRGNIAVSANGTPTVGAAANYEVATKQFTSKAAASGIIAISSLVFSASYLDTADVTEISINTRPF